MQSIRQEREGLSLSELRRYISRWVQSIWVVALLGVAIAGGGCPNDQAGCPMPPDGPIEGMGEGAGEGIGEGTGEGMSEGGGEGTTEGEGEPEGTSEGATEGISEEEGEGESEGAREGESEIEGEGESEGLAEGMGEGEGEIEGLSEGETEIEGEGESEVEGEGEGENEGEGESEMEGEGEGEGEQFSISGVVWLDGNQDGLMQFDEPRRADIVVHVLTQGGVILLTGLTDIAGEYHFTELPAGRYRVAVIAPEGFGFAPFQQGSDPGRDSDFNPETGESPAFDLTDMSVTGLDAGMIRLVCLQTYSGLTSQGFDVRLLADETLTFVYELDFGITSTCVDCDSTVFPRLLIGGGLAIQDGVFVYTLEGGSDVTIMGRFAEGSIDGDIFSGDDPRCGVCDDVETFMAAADGPCTIRGEPVPSP